MKQHVVFIFTFIFVLQAVLLQGKDALDQQDGNLTKATDEAIQTVVVQGQEAVNQQNGSPTKANDEAPQTVVVQGQEAVDQQNGNLTKDNNGEESGSVSGPAAAAGEVETRETGAQETVLQEQPNTSSNKTEKGEETEVDSNEATQEESRNTDPAQQEREEANTETENASQQQTQDTGTERKEEEIPKETVPEESSKEEPKDKGTETPTEKPKDQGSEGPEKEESKEPAVEDTGKEVPKEPDVEKEEEPGPEGPVPATKPAPTAETTPIATPKPTTVNVHPYPAINQICPSNFGVNDKIRNQALSEHNRYRSMLAKGNVPKSNGKKMPPAGNMMELEYDCKLEVSARNRAQSCVKTPNPDPNVQENLHVISKVNRNRLEAMRQSISEWWRQVQLNSPIPDFVLFRNRHKNSAISSFTRMAWATTTKIGCAVRSCIRNWHVVCHYSQPGNIVGHQIYAPGNACSACPGNKCNRSLGLCLA